MFIITHDSAAADQIGSSEYTAAEVAAMLSDEKDKDMLGHIRDYFARDGVMVYEMQATLEDWLELCEILRGGDLNA